MKRNQDPTEKSEKIVGWLIFGGVIAVILGIILTWLLYLGGTVRIMATDGKDPGMYALRGLGPLLVIAGLVSSVTGILMGWHRAKRPESGKGVQQIDPNTRVVGKFAFREGEMLTSDWQWEGIDDCEFYVKLEMSTGRVMEFQCSEAVFANCGDGLRGEATYDGRWLGRFVAYVGHPAATAAMPRDIFTDKD